MISILFFLILLCGIPIAAGVNHTYYNSSVHPSEAFKCEIVTIYVNYSDVPETGVQIYINSTGEYRNGQWFYDNRTESMMYEGGNTWVYYHYYPYTTVWGTRTLRFQAEDEEIISTNTTFFFFSDPCDEQVTSYRNITSMGFGNRTNMLFSGQQNILEFSQQPYIDYIGYFIYVLITGLFCMILYMKSQSVVQPLLLVVIMASTFVSSGYVPDQYRMYLLIISAGGLTAIFWRLAKS